jgi:hypothetical protein
MPMVHTFNLANAHLYWTREAYATSAYQSLGNVGVSLRQAAAPDDPSAGSRVPEGLGVGDPDHLIRVIKRWESAGVTGINFFLNCIELIPQQAVLDSLRLFAAEVMPAFRDSSAIRGPVYAPTEVPA